MDLNPEEFERLFEVFKIECDEHLAHLNAALVSLEENPDQADLIQEIFRNAHSLKGASRMIGFTEIEAIAHKMETLLGKVNNEALPFSSELNTLILKGLDNIALMLQNISETGEANVDASALLAEMARGIQGDFTESANQIAVKEEAEEPEEEAEKEENIPTRDLDLFAQETAEAHRKLVASLLEIERNPRSASDIKNAYEQAHALKGSARIVGHASMATLAFAMEKLLQPGLDERFKSSSEIIGKLLLASDLLKRLMAEVEEQEDFTPEAQPELAALLLSLDVLLQNTIETAETKPISASNKKSQNKQKSPVKKPKKTKIRRQQHSTVRVSAKKLDQLMDQTGELLTMKLKSRQRLLDIQAIINDYQPLNKAMKNVLQDKKPDIPPGASSIKGIRRSESDKHLEKLSEISDRLNLLHKALYDDSRNFSIIIERLQHEVQKTRLFPFSSVLDIFPRMVRDLAVSVNKKITLQSTGGNIELDKFILEEIKDPMMHIIRNCVDHGIESEESRIKAGKEATGLIKIAVAHKGNNAVIKVSDDGKGISLDRIRDAAIAKNLYDDKEIYQMKDKQVLNLIFHPGFSTSAIITDISGRGVGMDVVKANIEKLNGIIDIETAAGQGSTFTMVIPLTLSTTQSLKIAVGGGIYFLPVMMVEKIIKVVESALPLVEGFPAIFYDGSYIPYVRLAQVLELPEISEESRFLSKSGETAVAILRAGKTLAAFGMDRFMGEEEILMKGLGPFMKRVRNISGVTIRRDGTIAPVLNVTDLINTVQLRGISHSKRTTVASDVPPEHVILIVDDSTMTRTLEKNILASYGYRIITAIDGQDALLKLQSEHVDLVVSDIQMPNMDGLELTEKIKQDESLKQIPVVLVTALESVADKKRGIQVGADAYIVKSSFDQSNLLSTIQRLI